VTEKSPIVKPQTPEPERALTQHNNSQLAD